jgi:hypothetical protein
MVPFKEDMAIVDLYVPVGGDDVELSTLKRRRRMLVHHYDRQRAASLENRPEMARTLWVEMLR